MYRKYRIWALAMFLSYQGLAQLGGQRSFEFLNIPGNARLSGLGGVNVSLSDSDVNFFWSNPALVSDSLSGYASAGYQFYVADIGQAAFAYAHEFKSIGTVSFGVQHLGYGELIGYDATGAELGSFHSGETAVVISKSHQVSHFRMGINLKTVFSNLAGYRSSAMMFDLGGTFIHPTQNLTVGLAFKNLGFVLAEYSETSETKVPFDIQFGATFKPEHMPVRFSLTAHNLASAGDDYDDPNIEIDDLNTLDKIMSHVVIGTELLFHRNVNVLLAYNFLKGQELNTDNSGGKGFSIGAAVNIKAFEIVLSRSGYSVGNGIYSFTLNANLQSMILKKRTI